ncbi:MAG: response regulator [Wujia sp.]
MSTNRIMVIDDDITLLKSVEQLLIDQGYIVSLVKSGQQAIEALQKGNTPDLILLDIAMPDMNGYVTFQKIKEIMDVPIIFLTSMEDIKAELTGLELGAIDYITKPFVKDILLARIKNHLANINAYKEQKKKELPAVRFDEAKLVEMEALLTESEFKVGQKIALGYTNQEIAEEYNYSYSYVKKIAYRIFDKLDISKRNEIRSFFLE